MILRGEDWDRGLKILRQTEVKMPRTFAGVGSSRHSHLQVQLMDYISARKKVTVEEIYQDFYSNFESPRQFQEQMTMLQAQGFCGMITNGNKTYIKYKTDHKLHAMFGGSPTTSP